ncbi:hypothetical protein IFR05_011637 [Cadophora sp. M221]|nr:hypothetical protein IFR05_011637 [Cadophora sp. M221]
MKRDASSMKTSYNCIIIGGGTSGLTVANRLKTLPKRSPSLSTDIWTAVVRPSSYLPIIDFSTPQSSYLFTITSTPGFLIHGTRSLSVIVASILSLIPDAHTSVYAVVEKARKITR